MFHQNLGFQNTHYGQSFLFRTADKMLHSNGQYYFPIQLCPMQMYSWLDLKRLEFLTLTKSLLNFSLEWLLMNWPGTCLGFSFNLDKAITSRRILWIMNKLRMFTSCKSSLCRLCWQWGWCCVCCVWPVSQQTESGAWHGLPAHNLYLSLSLCFRSFPVSDSQTSRCSQSSRHGRSQVFAMLDTTLRLLYPLSEGGGGWCLVPVYLPALMQSSVARRQPDPIMSDVWWLMSVSTQTNPQIRSSLFLSYHVRTFKVNIIMKISTDRAWQSYKAITILFIQGYLGWYSLGQHQGHLRSSARPGKVRQTISQTMSSYRHYCSQHLEISIIFIVSNLIWQLLEPSFKGNRTTMI